VKRFIQFIEIDNTMARGLISVSVDEIQNLNFKGTLVAQAYYVVVVTSESHGGV
jgi:hypothetical protein